MSIINSSNNNNEVACAASQPKEIAMNGASVATPHAQKQDKLVVHHGSSDQHMRVVVVDHLYVHVVSVHKNIDDWCSNEVAPLYKRKGANGKEYWTKRTAQITKNYGIIKAPDGGYRERWFGSLDKFCKQFNIKHVNDLEWIYAEPGVVCHNTDPRDPWCPHNNERTGSEHRSGLQNAIDKDNYGYGKSCLLYTSPSPRDQRGGGIATCA